MVVYLSGGRISPASLCFDYENDEEERFVNDFLDLVARNKGINIRLLGEDEYKDGLDELLEGDFPFRSITDGSDE